MKHLMYFFKEFVKPVCYRLYRKAIAPYRSIKARFRYTRAVDIALKTFARTGERQYVMVYGDRLVIVSRSTLKDMKKRNAIDRRINIMGLASNCVYSTPYKNGTASLSCREKKLRKLRYVKYYISL